LSQGDTLKNSCTSWRNLLTPSGVVPRTDIKNALLQKNVFSHHQGGCELLLGILLGKSNDTTVGQGRRNSSK